MEILGCMLFPLGGLFALASLGLWVWMLIECATKERSDPDSGNTQLIWILIIVFANLIGALIYFLVRRPERIREYGEKRPPLRCRACEFSSPARPAWLAPRSVPTSVRLVTRFSG